MLKLPCPSVVCPVPSVFPSFRENTGRISMKFEGGNRYHQQFKRLHFGQNWNRASEQDVVRRTSH